MKTKLIFLSIVMLLSFFLFSLINAQKGNEDLLTVNYKNLVSRADLTYSKPAARSEDGMPIGNGKMGTLVWTTPTQLKMQINRVDVFASNSGSNNFYVRNTDYCGGAGFIDIDFINYGEEVFTEKNFQQHLSCYDGLMTLRANGISVKALAWNENDVIALNIIDQRKSQSSINTNLRMLRNAVSTIGNHSAISKLNIVGNKIILTQEFKEDNYYCGSAVVIGIVGNDATPRIENETTVLLSAKASNKPFTVFIASSASFDPKEDVVASATKQLDAAIAKGFSGLYESNKKWWSNYWSKAFVHLHSADGEADFVEQNYNYFLYLMGSSSLGNLPPKFNGMLWITGGDTRKWGGFYWGANQSCFYNGLFPTNRMELMEPFFKLYSGMYNSLAKAAEQEWNSKGIYIAETIGFDGLAEIPDDIAKEMQELYLMKKPWDQKSQRFIDYASTKTPFLSRWNWRRDDKWVDGKWLFADRGGGPYGPVSHIFSRGAKIAYQYWQRYEFTLDKEWLRTYAYPMIKGIAEFYRTFPNVKKESDGKYHIYYVNDNESVWGGHNTVEEISSMMGIFPAVLKASEILGIDADMRPIWKEFLDNLSTLPLNKDFPDEYKSSTPVMFARSLKPFIQGPASRRPDANTMPVWFFDLCNPDSKNSELVKIANSTYDAYFPNGINDKVKLHILNKLPIVGAIMGRADATKYLIPSQIRSDIPILANRMDLSEGVQTTNVQRLGRIADALHIALCQSAPPDPAEEPIIRVFHAWPKEWDAEFKLLERGGFLVTSSIQKEQVEFVELQSQVGGDCRLKNPWNNNEVTLYRNSKKAETISGELLKFSTSKDENIIAVKTGATPEQFKRVVLKKFSSPNPSTWKD